MCTVSSFSWTLLNAGDLKFVIFIHYQLNSIFNVRICAAWGWFVVLMLGTFFHLRKTHSIICYFRKYVHSVSSKILSLCVPVTNLLDYWQNLCNLLNLVPIWLLTVDDLLVYLHFINLAPNFYVIQLNHVGLKWYINNFLFLLFIPSRSKKSCKQLGKLGKFDC